MASGGADLLPSVQTLSENPKDVFLETSDVILRITRNILKDPTNPKYRRLRVSTSVFMDKLLPIDGAMECLFQLGFEENGEFFSMPDKFSLSMVSLMKDQLELQRRIKSGEAPKLEPLENDMPKTGTSANQNTQGGAQTKTSVKPSTQDPSKISGLKSKFINHPLLQKQMQFFKQIEAGMHNVMRYEDPQLQTQARSLIPVDYLQERASAKWKESRENRELGVSLQDLVLLELLAWFKHEFFKWVDSPNCEHCGGATNGVGSAIPTDGDLLWGASRVENYQCSLCRDFTRFPRYNHPAMLLQTRKGRCGEWANCFTLCCRTMGFEARFVQDWTDHVWTEVYSEAQRRWLHCDPCENVCDKPLLYEAGWGKKLSYVIAFSKDDIQDVTWRYSAKHQEVKSRRVDCSEAWLLLTIFRLRGRLWSNISEARKDVLKQRLVVEIVEFLTLKSANGDQLQGRTSGSLTWRQIRGETGAAKPKAYVIRPTSQEKAERLLHLRYSSSIDKYIRGKDGEEVTSGWSKMVFDCNNLFRKEESDWKMSYLARTEGSDTASVSWKIDLTDCQLVVDEVDIKAENMRFEDGQVVWRVCSDDQCTFLPPDGTRSVMGDHAGSRTLSISAHLRGGKGDCAWQHTQLFRQALSDESYPFEVIVKLKTE